jgi:hypothetical protein
MHQRLPPRVLLPLHKTSWHVLHLKSRPQPSAYTDAMKADLFSTTLHQHSQDHPLQYELILPHLPELYSVGSTLHVSARDTITLVPLYVESDTKFTLG